MANKQYPQGCGDGEEFRDNDIIGVYKPDDVPDVVDGSLNKKKTWLQVKTWIQNFVINTNTDNIAQNTDDIDVLENLVNQDVKTTATPTFFDVVLNTVGSVRLAIIDLLSRMTNTENATGVNAGKITTLETKTPQSYKTTDDVVFNSVNGLSTKVINIGDWDMVANGSIDILHGLTLAKIRAVNVLIRNDLDSSYYDFNSLGVIGGNVVSQSVRASATEIQLVRDADGFFDATAFDSTPYNRGWVTITYEI